MTKFEYHLAIIEADGIETATATLNALGAEGWELVAWSEGGGCVFKRPVEASMFGIDTEAVASKAADAAGAVASKAADAAETVKGAASDAVGKVGSLFSRIKG